MVEPVGGIRLGSGNGRNEPFQLPIAAATSSCLLLGQPSYGWTQWGMTATVAMSSWTCPYSHLHWCLRCLPLAHPSCGWSNKRIRGRNGREWGTNCTVRLEHQLLASSLGMPLIFSTMDEQLERTVSFHGHWNALVSSKRPYKHTEFKPAHSNNHSCHPFLACPCLVLNKTLLITDFLAIFLHGLNSYLVLHGGQMTSRKMEKWARKPITALPTMKPSIPDNS